MKQVELLPFSIIYQSRTVNSAFSKPDQRNSWGEVRLVEFKCLERGPKHSTWKDLIPPVCTAISTSKTRITQCSSDKFIGCSQIHSSLWWGSYNIFDAMSNFMGYNYPILSEIVVSDLPFN